MMSVVKNVSLAALFLAGTFLLSLDRTRAAFDPLDPQATDSIQISPTFCPFAQLTGTIPNDACIQSAINYACSTANSHTGNNAGTLIFTRANYYIKFGVSIPSSCAGLYFKGQGAGNGYTTNANTYIFSDNNCTGPIFNFYSNATQNYVYGGGMRDIAFYNAPFNGSRDGSVSCKYPLIQASYGEFMDFENIYSWLAYQQIKLIGGIHSKIDFMLLDQVLQDSPGALEFTGSGASAGSSAASATRQDAMLVRKVFGGGSSTVTAGHQLFIGIWWHAFSDTLELQDVAFENTKSVMKIDCTGGGAADISACPAFLQALDIQGEGAGGNLFDAQDFRHLIITDSYFHCFGASILGGCNDAMFLRNSTFSQTYGVQIKGGQFDSGQHAGIEAEIQGLNVSGASLFNNNLANTGGADVAISTPGAGHLSGQISIVNNFFCFNAGNTLTEAAVVFASGLDYLQATQNMFYGCGSGVTNNSGGGHVTITPNVGP